MDNFRVDVSINFETHKIISEDLKIKETLIAIHAYLNSGGGVVEWNFDNISRLINVNKANAAKLKDKFIRKLEQNLINTIGLLLTTFNINIQTAKAFNKVTITVESSSFLLTTNYNLFLPSETQVCVVSPVVSKHVVVYILNTNVVLASYVGKQPKVDSHEKEFIKNRDCGLRESKFVQLKYLKSQPAKCTTLANRIVGNKFSCYVSALANYIGGYIYYGITDDGVVEGELISDKEEKMKIEGRVEKAIKRMFWPSVRELTRKIHWEIYFEIVVDENSQPIPSTFVIVIYIASCSGGVFTERPECYRMAGEKIEKLPFLTWKEKILVNE